MVGALDPESGELAAVPATLHVTFPSPPARVCFPSVNKAGGETRWYPSALQALTSDLPHPPLGIPETARCRGCTQPLFAPAQGPGRGHSRPLEPHYPPKYPAQVFHCWLRHLPTRRQERARSRGVLRGEERAMTLTLASRKSALSILTAPTFLPSGFNSTPAVGPPTPHPTPPRRWRAEQGGRAAPGRVRVHRGGGKGGKGGGEPWIGQGDETSFP